MIMGDGVASGDNQFEGWFDSSVMGVNPVVRPHQLSRRSNIPRQNSAIPPDNPARPACM